MEVDLGTLIVQIINFLILFALFSIFLFKPLRETLERRSKAISDNIRAAEQARLEAQKKLEELERKLAEAEKEAQERMNERLKYAQKLSNSIIEKAKEEAEELKRSALKEIEEAKMRALEELKDVAALTIKEAFKELLSRDITQDYTRSAVEKVLRELAEVKR